MKKFAIGMLVLLTTTPVFAGGLDTWGIRAGWTHDSGFDHMFVGVHVLETQPFTNVDLLPSIELGFGDDVTVLAINGDLLYNFTELATPKWNFKAGAGLAVNYFDSKLSSNTELGLNIVGQVIRVLDNGNKAFIEIRFGIEDSPDFKLGLGLSFF